MFAVVKNFALAATVGLCAVSFAASAQAGLVLLGEGDAKSQNLNHFPYDPSPAGAVNTFLAENGNADPFNKQIVYFDASNKQTAQINGLALTGGPAIVRFTFLGTEAGNNNFFNLSDKLVLTNGVNPDAIFHNHSTPVGASIDLLFGGPNGIPLGPGGLLPFGFVTDGKYTNNAGAIADNAGATTEDSDPLTDPPDDMKLGFSLQRFTNSLGGDSILVFLGDGLGDSDFDDMVVGVGVFAVPVPPAAILLLTGLFGLGALKRFRRGPLTA